MLTLILPVHSSVAGPVDRDTAEYVAQNLADELSIELSQSIRLKAAESVLLDGIQVGYIAHFTPQGFAFIPALDELYPIQFLSFSTNYDEISDHPIFHDIKRRIHGSLSAFGYTNDARQSANTLRPPLPLDVKARTQLVKNSDRWTALLTPTFFRTDVMSKRSADDSPGDPGILPDEFGGTGGLITARWGQGNPWNAALATITESRLLPGKRPPPPNCSTVSRFPPLMRCKHTGIPVTGCVATAQGQVMHHWKWPQGAYNWSLMEDTADPQGEAAQLLADVGHSVDMDYGLHSSSAYTEDTEDSLEDDFNYDRGIRVVTSYLYDWAVYEIQSGRPTLLKLRNSNDSGHAAIADGYRQQDEMVHVNLGWRGSDNNYYKLDDVSSGHHFDTKKMVVGIKPNWTYYKDRREGVLYCEHTEYKGDCSGSTSSIFNLKGEGRNNEISTIKVHNGWQVTVCDEKDFQGPCASFVGNATDVEVNHDELNLLGLADDISSMKIERYTFPWLVPVIGLIM